MSRTYRRLNSVHRLSIVVDFIKKKEISDLTFNYPENKQLLEYPYKFNGFKKSSYQKFLDRYFRDGGYSELRRGCDCWVCNRPDIRKSLFNKQFNQNIINHKKGLDEEDYFDLYSCDCNCEYCNDCHINNIERICK